MNKEEIKAFAKEIADEAIAKIDARVNVTMDNIDSRVANTLAEMDRRSAESLSVTHEAFSVIMNDKMDQMHRDAMIMVEQIRDDNMIFGEAISGLSDKFDKMSNRLDTMDERFDRIDVKFEKVDDRLNDLTAEVKEVKEILIKNLDKRVHVLEVGGKQMVVNS